MGDEWKKVQLDEIATISSGKRPAKVSKQPTEECAVPVIGGGGISGCTNRALWEEDVLITGRVGTLGKLFATSYPCWPSDNTLVIHMSEANIDGAYLRYAVELSIPQVAAMNRGAANPLITQGDIGRLNIPLPPLTEQHAIAHILGSLDDKIELNRQMAQTLESIARAIFKSWFVDFDPVKAKMEGKQPEGMTEEIAALFPDRLVDSELGMIPEGWEYKALGDMINIFDSKRIPLSRSQRKARQGKYPYYGATSIMDYVDDYIFDGVYVLIGEDGSVKKPDGTPFLQYVSGKIWVNNHAHVIQGKRLVTSEYIYLFLSRFNIGPFITGAVQPKLNQGNLKLIPIISPDDKIMELFNETISIVFKKIICLQKECKTLQGLRDTLLPQLISGKIRVNQPEDAAA